MCINHDEDEHQALAAYFCINKDTTEKADVLIPSQSHALKATLDNTQ